MPELENTKAQTREVKTHLEQVRQLLMQSPGSFSVVTAGAALETISVGLLALHQAIEGEGGIAPDTRHEIAQVLTLSGRVNALYRQAANFYGGLAAESVQNGSWDAASYGAEGSWNSSPPRPGSRVRVDG